MSYTLPLSEAETQLRDLVKRTQETHTPVFLTTEESAKPVAVVLENDIYEQTQRIQQQYYHLQVVQLIRGLEQAEQYLDDPTACNEYITSWQQGLLSLWEIAPKTVQEFCAGLILSAKQMTAKSLTHEQLSALRFAVDVLRDTDPREVVKEEAIQRLIEAGIPPLLAYNDENLLQSYLDEL